MKLATGKCEFRVRHDALFRRLDEVISAHKGRKVLVYTHAIYETEVQRRYPEVDVQHFWTGRGKDEFKDHDLVIIFGTAEPNPQDLLDECRAFYADDPTPISAEPLPENYRHYTDARLETLLMMRREEEMEQAAHRIRPVWAEDSPKTIIVMSQVDLPGLPADEVIDPRALQYQTRKDLLATFMTDCFDKMGFYFDGMAEMAGIVESRSKTAHELKQRLGSTRSLITNSIRQPVLPSNGGDPMYPANRNAFYRDRDQILTAIELPSMTLTFNLARGRATIKVWGNAEAAEAWLTALVSDRLEPRKPFANTSLQAICLKYQVNIEVLFRAPTMADAYYGLFSDTVEIETGNNLEEMESSTPSESASYAASIESGGGVVGKESPDNPDNARLAAG